MKLRKIISVLLFSLFIVPVFGQDFPERPNPPKLVNDFAGFLKQNEVNSLEIKLEEFARKTSTQIAVVVVPTLNGYDKADYAISLAEKWGIGQKGKDNGILILVKPKKGNQKGEVFIATGYGLEGVVPDAIAKRIVEVEVIPEFKNGNYYQGLVNATNTLMSLTKGEFTAEEYAQAHGGGGSSSIISFFIFVVMIVIFSLISRAQRARQYSMGHKTSFWTAFLLGSMMGSSHRGHYGNFSSGSGGFGGFGGGSGGFGGFGGGSFGGGGAGGSW